MDNFFLLVFALGCVAGGLYYVWEGVRTNRLLQQSQNWPVAQGEIISSEGNKRISGPTMKHKSSHAFYASIRYRYSVEGHDYENDVVELAGRLRATPRMIAKQVAEYPRGARVDVYYDPTQPQHACLLRQGPGGWLNMIAGGAFAAFGAALLLRNLV